MAAARRFKTALAIRGLPVPTGVLPINRSEAEVEQNSFSWELGPIAHTGLNNKLI